MTNYEKIKNMSVEEMAKEMEETRIKEGCPLYRCPRMRLGKTTCYECWLSWLNQEVEE